MLKSKKLLIALILLIAILLLPNMVEAADTVTSTSTINGVTVNWSYKLNENNKIEDLKCTNAEVLTGSVSIPSIIDEKEVISIGNGAFENAQITSVTIPDSVEKIGINALLSIKEFSLSEFIKEVF